MTIKQRVNPYEYIKQVARDKGIRIYNYIDSPVNINLLVTKITSRGGLSSDVHYRVIQAWLATRPSDFLLKKRLNNMSGQYKKHGLDYKYFKSYKLIEDYYNNKVNNSFFYYSDFWKELSDIDDVLPAI